ncbi:hypothetical protein [Rhodococcoides kyotonense]|uniref:Glyoxalase-like domain-containing protein n=1 Tax=Rhodococcoides kyotonense TaxID=398843 RepID=A0A239IUD3_9NOCA|nr:hypothetical protein [Rhodococcus kyotonensis]SNS97179.1 hypothetical protein SAMN05421642_107230 [Rhodococcus kyotonensis]
MSDSLSSLFVKVTVMHSTSNWSETHRDLVDVLGPAIFSDGRAWAAFGGVSLSDESGPAWSLLAKTTDLDAVARVAGSLGWEVGTQQPGGHETRLRLVSPAGLTVIAYAPA